MRSIALLFITCSVSGMQIRKVNCEKFPPVAQVQCAFSSDYMVQYNPGFKVPIKAPPFFKKKYFFCPHCTISPLLLKKTQTYSNTHWAVIFKEVTIPCPGVLIICAYNPQEIAFSWLKDSVHSTYTFYFTYTVLQMVTPLHNDQPYYHAFNKDLPKFMSMCYI